MNRLRSLLIIGCALGIGLATWHGTAVGTSFPDPALIRLLRGMALLKGAMAIAALLAVFWRFGWPMSPPVALGYLLCTWTLAGASVLIWRLTLIPFAAVSFHAALLGILAAAWQDDLRRRPFLHHGRHHVPQHQDAVQLRAPGH